MKLLNYRGDDGLARVGALVDGQVIDIDDPVAALAVPAEVAAQLARHGVAPATRGMLRLLQAGPAGLQKIELQKIELQQTGLQQARVQGHSRPLAAVQLLAPVPRPGKIVGVGRNYADHAAETGVAAFEKPRVIFKLPSSVCGPGSAVMRPAQVHKLDYEVELAVVIGSAAKDVRQADALRHVAGYTVLNDVSAREFQFDVSPPQTTFAKSMDGFCPMGPWLVTADELGDPQVLTVTTHVNGEELQHGHTADMLFPVARLIEYLSGFMTLEPGDIIATGTPAGVGAFRKPPRWLQPGDRVRLEVSGVGVLEHTIAGT